jgi:hypothetical protein
VQEGGVDAGAVRTADALTGGHLAVVEPVEPVELRSSATVVAQRLLATLPEPGAGEQS